MQRLAISLHLASFGENQSLSTPIIEIDAKLLLRHRAGAVVPTLDRRLSSGCGLKQDFVERPFRG